MFWAVIVAVAVIASAWLARINSAMQSVPEDVQKASPRRWTKDQLQDVYQRVKQNPIDFVRLLPPRLNRRYIVVGGSGEPLCPAQIRHSRAWTLR